MTSNASISVSLCALMTAVLAASSASAESFSQPETVVELFTSQGCSSCPPANEAVVEMDRASPDILTLSYGVTYWDYLGWQDTFGDPKFTARQRQYDASLDSGVYTPMLVRNGQAHHSRIRSGFFSGKPVSRQIALTRHSGELCIEGTAEVGAKLALVEYSPGVRDVAVKRGENQGRHLKLANVVTDVRYRDWSGDMICGLMPKSALAVLAHDATTAEVIGAARFEP